MRKKSGEGQQLKSESFVRSPEDSARDIRARVLDEVQRLAGGDAAAFFSLADVEGAARIAEWMTTGDASGARAMRVLAARPELLHASAAARFRRPDPAHSKSFLELSAVMSWELYVQTEFFKAVFEPNGLEDKLRLVVYDGDRFVGWIGAFRNAGRRFTRADRRALAPHVERITAALIEADRRSATLLPRSGACVVARADGEVEYASESGAAWLSHPGHGEALSAAIAGLPNGLEDRAWLSVAHRAELRIIRVDGKGVVRFLVQLEPARALRTATDTLLSPVQRQVALFAASGATIGQIAQSMNRAPETVRSHLREAYTRLGVSSRLELARALETDRAA